MPLVFCWTFYWQTTFFSVKGNKSPKDQRTPARSMYIWSTLTPLTDQVNSYPSSIHFSITVDFRMFFFFGKTYTKASPPKPKPGHASVWAFSNAWELSKSSRKPTKGVGSSCKPKKIDRCPKKLSPPKKLACPLKMKQLLFWGHVTISGGLKTRNAEVCPSKNAFCREACEVNVVCGWNVPGCAFDGYTAYGDSAGNGRFRRWPTQNLRRGDLLEGMVEEMDRDGYGYKEK